jgi:hypothetical protein
MILILALAAALSQAPAPAPKEERLTSTEVLALNTVTSEINKASQDAANVEADIQKNHPGYTFDFHTGQLVKVVPIKKPEAQEKKEDRVTPVIPPKT